MSAALAASAAASVFWAAFLLAPRIFPVDPDTIRDPLPAVFLLVMVGGPAVFVSSSIATVSFGFSGLESGGHGFQIHLVISCVSLLVWWGPVLTTEAPWENAPRAGSITRRCLPDSGSLISANDEASVKDYAWYSANSGSRTHPVGHKRPKRRSPQSGGRCTLAAPLVC